MEKVAHRIPVIAGTGSNDCAYAIELSRHACAAGADALLHVTPYYNKTSQRGLVRHFEKNRRRLRQARDFCTTSPRARNGHFAETYRELAKHPNIVATKEAAGTSASSPNCSPAAGRAVCVQRQRRPDHPADGRRRFGAYQRAVQRDARRVSHDAPFSGGRLEAGERRRAAFG